jgi:hypothetical protein
MKIPRKLNENFKIAFSHEKGQMKAWLNNDTNPPAMQEMTS